MRRIIIPGPPGTGKTHRLMHYLEAELKMTKPDKIAYIAFSNAAANEAKKRITNDIRKTLNSAVANAENNFQYDIDKLVVKEAYCGKKITMKRFRPRAKGRAAPILKPYSNLTIILSEKLQKKEAKDGTKG